MKYSKCSRIDDTARRLVREGWQPFNRGRHQKLRAPGGAVVSIPSTPSDHRAAQNWIHQVRRLERAATPQHQ